MNLSKASDFYALGKYISKPRVIINKDDELIIPSQYMNTKMSTNVNMH